MRPRLNSFGNHISQTSYEANTVQSLIVTWFGYVACIHSLSIKLYQTSGSVIGQTPMPEFYNLQGMTVFDM